MKGFWKCLGDNSTLEWTCLLILNFEEYLSTDSGPNTSATAAAPVPGLTPTTAKDVTTVMNALSAALLTKPSSSRTDIFLKNKGRGDEVKPLKEAKPWNSWQRTFLSLTDSYDFKHMTNSMYVPNTLDCDAENVFDLQQKHAFGILVANAKESSAMPIIHCYSDPQATDYGDAQQLYAHLVTHYTQGLSGRQCLKILECNIDYLHFDKNWAKTCEAFLIWSTTN